MLLKKYTSFLIIITLMISCSENDTNTFVQEKEPSSFEKVLSETEGFISLTKGGQINIDSSSIGSFVNTYDLHQNKGSYRSESDYGDILLKRIFTCKDSTINSVHFDFYYDSINPSLIKDSDSLLSFLNNKLGNYEKETSDNNIRTYTWVVNKNILDFEIFNNGYTFTLRKKKSIENPTKQEKKLASHIVLVKQLLENISNKKIKLGVSAKTIQNIFEEEFETKGSSIFLSKKFNEKILLSASFTFDNNGLSGLYFDYVYADTNTTGILIDAKLIKTLINGLNGQPNEIATVAISTYFEWDKTPIKLEIYSNGFSIIMEKQNV